MIVSVPGVGQSREGARKQMNQGNYANAITLLTALEEIYPGEFSADLSLARRCLRLQNQAKSKYAQEHFTEAEELYKQILKLNPNDNNASQRVVKCQVERDKFLASEFSKCKTISDYRLFAQKYPNSPQAKIANERVMENEQERQDSESWSQATRDGSLSAYSRYISNANPRAAHLGEAHRNLARLYFENAQKAYTDDKKSSYFFEALKHFEKSKSYKTYFWTDDEDKYNACLAEQKYSDLEVNPSYAKLTSFINWSKGFENNKIVNPHLHTRQVNAMLIGAYCSRGMYSEARAFLEQNYDNITSSVFTINSNKEWTKNEWRTYIKEREKQSKRKPQTTYRRAPSPSKTIPIRLPITLGIMDFKDRYAQIGVGICFGDYYDKFNLDVMAIASVSDYANDNRFVFSIAPTYNIVDCSEGYHFNVQPVIGYDTSNQVMIGARTGIGWEFFDFSVGASYEKKLGLMLDFRLRMNINLVGR